jgi:hypothetical protein
VNNADYTLPAPPVVPVPEDIELVTGVPADADPRLTEIQTLENWAKIYKERATQLLRELWAEKNHTEDELAAATGLTRFGNRKRADPTFNESVNQRRRQRRSEDRHPGEP